MDEGIGFDVISFWMAFTFSVAFGLLNAWLWLIFPWRKFLKSFGDNLDKPLFHPLGINGKHLGTTGLLVIFTALVVPVSIHARLFAYGVGLGLGLIIFGFGVTVTNSLIASGRLSAYREQAAAQGLSSGGSSPSARFQFNLAEEVSSLAADISVSARCLLEALAAEVKAMLAVVANFLFE